MLSILDRYSHRIECKGGERQLRARKIIVTSAKAPEECYKNCGEDIKQLLRRIDTVTKLCNKDEGVILEPLVTKNQPIGQINTEKDNIEISDTEVVQLLKDLESI